MIVFERGFDGDQVMYEYTMDGTYLGENEISRSSSSKHQCIRHITLQHQGIYG